MTFGFNILVKNLSQKWVFNSTANLNSNLGPFWCVMSTFNNQVTSRFTESGSEFFQFFFFLLLNIMFHSEICHITAVKWVEKAVSY